MSMLCCLKSCQARYIRLVDNIFPSNPSEGIRRSEMEKLTYYALSAPEKLHRIGEYLSTILGRDIARRRDGSVHISMEALNQLLLACHSQQINLFVESFLKMVATLLESNNPNFQVLGTVSFVKFSKIEEDTASYHRRYDFFVSKFSAMCHNNDADQNIRLLVRQHGVRGLQGVIRKTVSDELQVNIWEKPHMNKIVPSLLINMQDNTFDITVKDSSTPADDQNPAFLAEQALRELLSKASFPTLTTALIPAEEHLDTHKLWVPSNNFATKAFTVIVYSVQSQYSHLVVKSLLDHLSNHLEDESTKVSILDVLCTIVPIPSSVALGPSVIDTFNILALHMKTISSPDDPQELLRQKILETAGVFAFVIPDYQKLEAMTFYLNKVSTIFDTISLQSPKQAENDSILISLILQCVLKICQPYKNINLSSMSSFIIDPLLKLSIALEPADRVLTTKVLLKLTDKNNNSSRLRFVDTFTEISALGLLPSNASKADREFLASQLPNIINFFYHSFLLNNNDVINFATLCECLIIISLSVTSPDTLIEMCRLLLAVQFAAVDHMTSSPDSTGLVTRVFAATGCCMLFLAHFSAVPELQDYVTEVFERRRALHPLLLPKSLNSEKQDTDLELSSILKKILFTPEAVHAAFKGRSGFSADRIHEPLSQQRHNALESGSVRSMVLTETDSIQINIEPPQVDQGSSASDQELIPASAITFKFLKQQISNYKKEMKEENVRKQKMAQHYRTATFEQLMSEVTPDPSEVNRQYLDKLFSSLLSHDKDEEEEEGINDWHVPTLLKL